MIVLKKYTKNITGFSKKKQTCSGEMDRVGPENDMPWQLWVHSQNYFLFCIIKEPKSYGKIILMVFPKNI